MESERHNKTPAQSTSLAITGERTVPGVWHENYMDLHHPSAVPSGIPRCKRWSVVRLVIVTAKCGFAGYIQLVVTRQAGPRLQEWCPRGASPAQPARESYGVV